MRFRFVGAIASKKCLRLNLRLVYLFLEILAKKGDTMFRVSDRFPRAVSFHGLSVNTTPLMAQEIGNFEMELSSFSNTQTQLLSATSKLRGVNLLLTETHPTGQHEWASILRCQRQKPSYLRNRGDDAHYADNPLGMKI